MFAANAIGFYLDAEDRLTPKIKSASSAYDKFTKVMDAANTRLFARANRGLAQMSRMTEKMAVAQSSSTSRQISKSISKILSSATLRLSATLPGRRSGLFASGPLRTAMKEQPYPPDYKGIFKNIPRFAKGGVVPNVPGSNPSRDSVLSLLTPGELVLPKDMFGGMQSVGRNALGQFASVGRAGLKHLQALAAETENLTTAGEKWLEVWEQTKDPKDWKQYDRAIDEATKSYKELEKAMNKMSAASKAKMLPTLKKQKQDLDALKKAGREFSKIASAISVVKSGSASAFNMGLDKLQQSGEEISSFNKELMSLTHVGNLTRAELLALGKDASGLAATLKLDALGADNLSAAIRGLAEAGAKNVDILPLSVVVGSILQTTGANVSELAKRLTVDLGGSTRGTIKILTTLMRVSRETGINMDALAESAYHAGTGFETYLSVLSDETKRGKAMVAMAGVEAFSKKFNLETLRLNERLAEALGGSREAQQELFMITGMGIEEIQKNIESGDILGLFDKISAKLRLMTGDISKLSPAQQATVFRDFGESLGIGGDSMAKMVKLFPTYRSELEKISAVSPLAANADFLQKALASSTSLLGGLGAIWNKQLAAGGGFFGDLWREASDAGLNPVSIVIDLIRSLGGLIGKSEGGFVPSTPGSIPGVDSVPAMLTPGEFVIPADVMKKSLSSGAGSMVPMSSSGATPVGNLVIPVVVTGGNVNANDEKTHEQMAELILLMRTLIGSVSPAPQYAAPAQSTYPDVRTAAIAAGVL